MSQNPYSGTGMRAGGPPGGFEQYSAEPRTSMLAVASLVLGVLSLVTCCVGAVAGVPAAALGIGSLLAMNSKDGELRGRGMAISGIIMGTIGLFVSIVLWAGAATAFNGVVGVISRPMTGIEAADVRPLKEALTPEAAAKLDEPKLLAFRKAYQDRLGSFKSVDTNLWRFAKLAIGTWAGDPQAKQMMAVGKKLPLAVWGHFDKGDAKIWFIVPQQARNSGPNKSDIFLDVVIVPEQGDPIYLIGNTADSTGTGVNTPANPPTAPDQSKPDATQPTAPTPAPTTPPTGG